MGAATPGSAKPTRKQASKAVKPRAKAKPRTAKVSAKPPTRSARKPMPDIGRPAEPPEVITAEAYKAGVYEVQPQFRGPGPVELSRGALSVTPAQDASDDAQPRPDAPEGLGEGVGDDPAALEMEPQELEPQEPPAPLTHVRMVHDDPNASADPYPSHPAGGIVVPLGMASSLRSAGFRVEHEHEIEQDG